MMSRISCLIGVVCFLVVFCPGVAEAMNATSYGVPLALQFDTPLAWKRCSTQTLSLTGISLVDLTFTLSGAERWAYIATSTPYSNQKLGWTHMYDYQDVYTDKTFSCVLRDTTETLGCNSTQISNTGRFYTTTQLTTSKAMYFSFKRCDNTTGAAVDSMQLDIWVVGSAALCTQPSIITSASVCNPSSAHGLRVSMFMMVAILALALVAML